MRTVCIGGGPGGLYFSVLAKRANPAHHISVYERNRADETFGFGVVFSDATMDLLVEQDRLIYPHLTRHAVRWDSVAKQVRTLAALAGVGRLTLGLGLSPRRDNCDACGVPFDNAAASSTSSWPT